MEKRKKSGLTLGALLVAYTGTSMIAGDTFDINRNYLVPIRDWVTQTETAEDFASYTSVDILTDVNSQGQRETYLSFERPDGTLQISPIDRRGYAQPDDLMERFDNFVSRQRSYLEQTTGYKKLEQFNDKVELMFDYSKMKVKEFFDNMRWNK